MTHPADGTMLRELNSMQAACFVGREPQTMLGGVASHLYTEFNGCGIDADRLQQALERLAKLHPMMALRVTDDGQQTIADTPQFPVLEIDDLRGQPLSEKQDFLEKKRQIWTHQKLDLRSGQVVRFSLTLLDDGQFRFHADTDMIAIDPSSFRLLMHDLAALYQAPETVCQPAATYFDWLDRYRSDSAQKKTRERDKNWWRARLATIPPAPTLPLRTDMDQPQSHRLSRQIDAVQWQSLQKLARRYRVTAAAMMLGLFATTLGRKIGDRQFRLNVPMFWRLPLVEDVGNIAGEFANILIAEIDLDAAPTLADLCRQLQSRLISQMEHSAYSGVNVMRDLSRHHGRPQLAPVVFTAALDLEGGALFSDTVRQVFGVMDWAVSQGSQVALDVQMAAYEDGLLVNWDIRLDALPAQWVSDLFDDFIACLDKAADVPDYLEAVQIVAPKKKHQPLTALQRAYLAGRGESVPLGGVAMQEFREYRGIFDPAVLKCRLQEMVERHACLRTWIEPQVFMQSIRADAQANWEEIDYRGLSRAEAICRIEQQREAYAHEIIGAERAPWQITLFRLPKLEGAAEDYILFARFDAMIADGRSIAQLMRELFEGGSGTDQDDETAAAHYDDVQLNADAAYWKDKLQAVEAPLRLPWRKPLDQVMQSRYRRESMVIPAAIFSALNRVGARKGLFKNSVLTALVLEVLSCRTEENSLCVGIPVAPQITATLANHSSFIAVNWQKQEGDFATRAAVLQQDVLEGLSHPAFSGVDIARLLFENTGSLPVLPVVITNGLSWPVLGQDSSAYLHSGQTQTPQVAMDIRFSVNAAGDLVFDIDYAREALDQAMVQDILQALSKAAHKIAASGEFAVSIRAITDLSHYCFNNMSVIAQDAPFLRRIADHIFNADNNEIALICGEQRISYAELGGIVRRITGGLQARGLAQGSVVAICLPRSPEHTAMVLACALSGIIWVPVDAASPQERLDYLLENCCPDLVVSTEDVTTAHPVVTFEVLMTAEPVASPSLSPATLSLSESPAYYLYTSGTTGKPKCVVLTNRSTNNVITCTLENWQATERDVFISVTPLHHDMSVFDVLGALTVGATLVLPEAGEEKNAIRWNQLVAEHRVTLWCSVPAILEMLLACRRGDELTSLRLIAQGGDYIKPVIIAGLRELLPQTRLVSLGGPTETTIWSIWHEIRAEDVHIIPYGIPLPENSYFVLDEQGEHCPAGVAGRIHTAGVNVALGYLESGEIIQTDFVTISDEKGTELRAFKTGDRGRYRHDGVIVFDSRVNGYVKIRGVRVSLPDVENELITHPQLRQIIVVDIGDQKQGEATLGAVYVVESGAQLSSVALRDFARERLPQSHVPSHFMQLDELPFSRNGKPDRVAARKILEAVQPAEKTKPAVPEISPAQRKVLEIYLDVLKPEAAQPVCATADFIGLGLRPQHLILIAARLSESFSVSLSPAQLMRCRNVQDVSALLKA
ncbi:amino acid adenylation domain-containing protein [Brucella sp. TWI559]